MLCKKIYQSKTCHHELIWRHTLNLYSDHFNQQLSQDRSWMWPSHDIVATRCWMISHTLIHAAAIRRTKCVSNLNATSFDQVNGRPVAPQPLTNSMMGGMINLISDHCTTVQCLGLNACCAHSLPQRMQTTPIIWLTTAINPVNLLSYQLQLLQTFYVSSCQ